MSRKKIKATVHWFDNLSQEGMIRVPGKGSVYVNNDPVAGHRLTKGKALNLKPGQPVLVTVFEDYQWSQIDSLKVV